VILVTLQIIVLNVKKLSSLKTQSASYVLKDVKLVQMMKLVVNVMKDNSYTGTVLNVLILSVMLKTVLVVEIIIYVKNVNMVSSKMNKDNVLNV
jgi:hypothetical protein